jgi:hypothetical protein
MYSFFIIIIAASLISLLFEYHLIMCCIAVEEKMLLLLEEIKDQNQTVIALLQESINANKKRDDVSFDLPFEFPISTKEQFEQVNCQALDADIKGKLVKD